MHMSKTKAVGFQLFCFLSAGLMVFAVGSAQAALVASDSFAITAGGDDYNVEELRSQTATVGTTGYVAANWWLNNTAALYISSGSLTHPLIAGTALDGKVVAYSGTGSVSRHQIRQLDYTPATGTYFFSALFRKNSTSQDLVAGVIGNTGLNVDFQTGPDLMIGLNDGAFVIAIPGSGVTTLIASGSLPANRVYLGVMEINYSSTASDSVTVTVYDDIGDEVTTQTYTGLNLDGRLGYFGIATKDFGPDVEVDELRYGTELSDVMLVVPGIAWTDLASTNVLPYSAYASATLNTNLQTCILVWEETSTAPDPGPGSTNDWSYHLDLGTPSAGTVSCHMTNLLPNTAYTWRFYGTNATTNGWSDAVSMTSARNGEWLYSLQITFTNFTGRGTLTNFPALVKLDTSNTDSYAGFLDAENGYDLRFWDNSGFSGTPLNYEIEALDTNGTSAVWVCVPAFTHNTSIWASWGDVNSQQASTTNGATWSEGFAAVYHLSGTANDSTSNGNDGATSGGDPTPTATSVIGGAYDFDGNDDINAPDDASLDLTDALTLSGWFRAGAWNQWSGIISKGSDNAYEIEQHGGNGDFRMRINNSSAQAPAVSGLSLDTWYYISGTYDRQNAILYLDGQEQSSFALTSAINNNNTALSLGDRSNNDYFTGQLDEMRVSSVARSSNWVWACYMNQGTDHEDFVAYGAVSDPVWALLDTTNILNTSAFASALLNTNLQTAALVWEASSTAPTADATNDWDNVLDLGSPTSGLLSQQMTSLSPSTDYTWRLFGTNTNGEAWSQPVTFTTIGAPTADNGGGATNVTAFTAQLRGELTAGVEATAYICWGETNPGTPEDTNNWDNVESMGLQNQGVPFYQNVLLDQGTTYYYSCFVTNLVGGDWSPVTNFTTGTRSPQTLYWEGSNTGGTGDGNGASAGGDGTWDRLTKNWDDGSDRVGWGIEDSAVFGGTAGTVTLGTDVNVSNMTFTTANYEITGNTITVLNGGEISNNVTATISSALAGSSGVTKSGTGQLNLGGTSTYTGGTTIEAGTLNVTADESLGASDTAINFDGSATFKFDKSGGSTLDLGARPIAINNESIATIVTGQGERLYTTGAVTGDGGLYWTPGGGVVGYLKLLSENNTFTGPLSLWGSYGGTTCTLGSLADSTNAITFKSGSIALEFDTSSDVNLNNRPITLNASATIKNSSPSDLVFNGPITVAGTGSKTLTLTGGGSLPGNIDEGSSTFGLTLSGGWTISGNNSYSGDTTISRDGGYLWIESSSALPPTSRVVAGRSTTLALQLDEAGTVNLGNRYRLYPSDTSAGVTSTHTIDVRNNGGSTTGATIAMGKLEFGGGDLRPGRQLNVTGANGYLLQLGDVEMSTEVQGSATGGAQRFNPTTASLVITGVVKHVDGNSGSYANAMNLYLGGTASGNLISGTIADADDYVNGGNGNAAPLNVYKAGSGDWTVSGANSYSGTTTVVAGKLLVTGSLNGSGAVTISGGALGGTGYISGVTTLSGSGGIDLLDGSVGTMTLGNGLSISGSAGANTLSFDLGTEGAGTDKIVVTGNVTMATSGAGVITLNQLSGTRIDAGTNDLIAATGTMPAASNFTLDTTALAGNTFSLQVTGSTLQLVVIAPPPAPASAFWTGGQDDDWSNTNNWSTDASGATTLSAVPGYETDVSFYASGASRLTSGALDGDFDINSLTYTTGAVANTTIGGAPTNIILEAATGITVNTPASGTPTHTISADISITTNQTWDVSSGAALTISGVIDDFGAGYGVTKSGLGTLHFSGLNTYNGVTVIDEGTLEIASAATYVTTTPNGLGMASTDAANLVINPGATLRFVTSSTERTMDRAFTINGSAPGDSVTIETSGTGFRGVYMTYAGALTYGATDQTRTLVLAGTQASSGGNWDRNTRLHARITDNGSGAVSLVKNGSGSWEVRANNTYTGGTTINGGSLRVRAVDTLPSAGAVVLADTAGAILDLSNLGYASYSQTIGSLSGGGNSGGNVALGSATLTVGDANDTTFAGVISGTGNLVKQGSGALTLSAVNTYSGTTTINAGKLVVTGSTSASSAVDVSAGALGGTGTVGGAVTLSGTGGIDLEDGTVGTLAIDSNLSISGVAGANNFYFDLGVGATGVDSITVNGNVTMATSGAAIINFTQLAGGSLDAGTYDLIVATGTMPAASNFSLLTSSAYGLNFALQLDGTSKKLQVVVTSSGTPPDFAFWKGAGSDNHWSTLDNWVTNAAGATAPTVAPGFNSAVSFYANSPSRLTTGALDADFNIDSLTYIAGATSDTTIGGSAYTLTIEGSSGTGLTVNTPSSGTPVHTIESVVAMADSQTWAVESGGALTVSGAVSDLGSGHSLTKSGAGTLSFAASNTYSGVTSIEGGTLAIDNVEDGGNASALGQSSASAANLLLSDSATLRYDCGSTLFTTDRSFTINGSSAGDSATLESHSVGAGSTKGVYFTSTASPSYGTADQTRSLILDGSFAASGVNSEYYNRLYAAVADNGLGAVSVIKRGTGSWGLMTANTFTGGLFVEEGTLKLLSSSAAGSGTVTIGSAGKSATLDLKGVTGGNRSIKGLATAGTAANQTITSTAPGGVLKYDGASSSTFGGVITGSTASYTALTVENAAAQLTLTGVNTYSGNTTVNAGTLLVDGSLAAGSAVTVNSGGTLGGSGTINGLTTIQSGGTLAPAGTNATDTLTFGGGLTLNGGSALAMALGTSSDLIRITGGILTGPSSGTVALNISDGGGIDPGIYPLINWTGAAGSVSTNDFTLSELPGEMPGELSVESSILSLEILGVSGTLFRFK
jgi:autotransporter-associated beta strand protein